MKAPDEPKPFDLIELTDSVDDLPAGTRGTVIIEGIGQSLVDLDWGEAGTGSLAQGHVRAIPTGSMQLIRRRSFDAALGAERRPAPR